MLEQAAAGTHDSVINLIRSLGVNSDDMKALDAPCGHGGISKTLSELGYTVEALDIEVPDVKIDNVNVIKHDLNEVLPYPDASFDTCVSVEGIEHLERPADFFHELVRILKPGGNLILSTPNPDSFRSRYRYFVKGYQTHFNPVSSTARTSGHIHPIDRLFIEKNRKLAQLEIKSITTNSMKGKKLPWTLLKGNLTRKLPEIYKNDVVMFGDVIVYHFIKTPL